MMGGMRPPMFGVMPGMMPGMMGMGPMGGMMMPNAEELRRQHIQQAAEARAAAGGGGQNAVDANVERFKELLADNGEQA